MVIFLKNKNLKKEIDKDDTNYMRLDSCELF